jgi:hypothetical protein
MAAKAEGEDRYCVEHRDRIRRGQSNGSKHMHDQFLGEWWVHYRLAGRIETESREALIAELCWLRDNYPGIQGAYDQAAAETGYQMAIRALLGELESSSPANDAS